MLSLVGGEVIRQYLSSIPRPTSRGMWWSALLCNTGDGVTPWPLLRSPSLQLTFSQSTFIMTTTASGQHNTVSLGHILSVVHTALGTFASKIDWFNVRCKMPRAKQKVQFYTFKHIILHYQEVDFIINIYLKILSLLRSLDAAPGRSLPCV